MWRLFFPLRYFALVNPEKRHIDLWPTLGLALVVAVPYIALSPASFYGQGGFLDKLILLTSALSGFYVAALVAAATFTNESFDKPITVGPIKMPTRTPDGERDYEHLTRREFTTILFGYLAFNALVLSLAAVVLVPMAAIDLHPLALIPRIGFIFAPVVVRYGSYVGIFILAAITAHLAVVTCLGLYYLMGRMYRREPRIITKKPTEQDAA